jgi:hypothetical protein
MPLGLSRPLTPWVRYRLRRAMLYNARLAPGYARLMPGTRPYLVQPDTDLLIEGYPRSANTFAVIAFEHANGTGLQIAHHLHSPVNLERAVQFGIPAIALIRDPLPTIASHMVRSPWIRPEDGLTGYLRFYDRVQRLTENVVVADYHELITDFGPALTRTNQRFGTTFKPYLPTPENNIAVLNRIDDLDREDNGGALHVMRVCRPHPAREAHKIEALKRLREPRFNKLVSQVEAIYENLTAPSETSAQ